MRQWNQVKRVLIAPKMEDLPYDLIKFWRADELGDGKFSYRYNQFWTQQIDLVVHPTLAVKKRSGGGDTFASRFGFSGETAANGCEISLRAKFCFTQITESGKPLK